MPDSSMRKRVNACTLIFSEWSCPCFQGFKIVFGNVYKCGAGHRVNGVGSSCEWLFLCVYIFWSQKYCDHLMALSYILPLHVAHLANQFNWKYQQQTSSKYRYLERGRKSAFVFCWGFQRDGF